MNDSAQGVYTTKPVDQPAPTQLDDRNDPPALSEPNEEGSIKKELGGTIVFTGGRDYVSPKVRVVASTYHGAEDDEKALYISQGKDNGISLSLETLESIIAWAKEK